MAKTLGHGGHIVGATAPARYRPIRPTDTNPGGCQGMHKTMAGCIPGINGQSSSTRGATATFQRRAGAERKAAHLPDNRSKGTHGRREDLCKAGPELDFLRALAVIRALFRGASASPSRSGVGKGWRRSRHQGMQMACGTQAERRISSPIVRLVTADGNAMPDSKGDGWECRIRSSAAVRADVAFDARSSPRGISWHFHSKLA